MSACYSVQALEVSVPVEEYLHTCVDVERFLGCCQICDHYNHTWSCPPFDFEPMDLWKQSQTLRIFARILIAKPQAELAAMLEGLEQEKGRLLEDLLALERDTPGSLALPVGGCTLCEGKCTRPEGKPCRHPDKMRHSLDALGGDISKTMEKYFDKPILWIQDGKTPEYLTLVGGLLIQKDDEGEGVIREFELHDLEQVMQLWLNGNLDAHDFTPADYWLSHAEMVRMHLLQAEVLVFVQKNTVLGFAGMQGDYLAGIFVDGQHRSNGIGKQLLEHLKQIHPAITLHVYRRNVRALEFYRKEGFQVTAEEWDAQTGEDECTMVWHREND